MISTDESDSDIRLTDLTSSMSRRTVDRPISITDMRNATSITAASKAEVNLRAELRRSVSFQATPKRQAPRRPTASSENVDASPINTAENLNATR